MKKIFLLLLSTLLSVVVFSQSDTLKPTKSMALIRVSVIDDSGKPIDREKVTFTSRSKFDQFYGVTSENGKFSIHLPIGYTYIVEYDNMLSKERHEEITIPKEPALYTWDVNIEFKPARVIVLENVEFDFNEATIKPISFKTLSELYDVMSLKPQLIIEIGGHTDNIGTHESNMTLSLARAERIKQYLVNRGIAPNRIQTKGYAATIPIADNSNDEGRQKNRRTEVKVISE